MKFYDLNKSIMILVIAIFFSTSFIFAEDTTVEEDQVIELYVATFNRAPDKAGLDYWLNEMRNNSWSIEMVAQSMFDQPETLALYPTATTTSSFISSIYKNILNRDSDADGLAYWQNELESGAVAKEFFVIAIINGAKSDTGGEGDSQVLLNKGTVSRYFAIDKNMNNVDLASTIIGLVTSSEDSVLIPIEIIDSASQIPTFTCPTGEEMTITTYGVEDLFSNGTEASSPSAYLMDIDWIASYANLPITGYDETSNDRIFADYIHDLPANITKGTFYIGLKSNGSPLQGNDTFKVGDYSVSKIFQSPLQDLSSNGWSNQLIPPGIDGIYTDIYYNDFNNITLNDGTTLLQLANANGAFDVVVEDDTSVDFITVATCSKAPSIIDEIEEVIDFECKDNEQLVSIIGGTVDGFATVTIDPLPTPRATLASAFPDTLQGVATYDETSVNMKLLDTLNLVRYPGTITRAVFSIGYKPLGEIQGNDTLTIGEYGVAHKSAYLYDGYASSITNAGSNWSIDTLFNGEKIAKHELVSLIININGEGVTMLDWIQDQGQFDVYVEDDTSVDFVHLGLCIIPSDGAITLNEEISTD